SRRESQRHAEVVNHLKIVHLQNVDVLLDHKIGQEPEIVVVLVGRKEVRRVRLLRDSLEVRPPSKCVKHAHFYSSTSQFSWHSRKTRAGTISLGNESAVDEECDARLPRQCRS